LPLGDALVAPLTLLRGRADLISLWLNKRAALVPDPELEAWLRPNLAMIVDAAHARHAGVSCAADDQLVVRQGLTARRASW
jgi:hypothetical protein